MEGAMPREGMTPPPVPGAPPPAPPVVPRVRGDVDALPTAFDPPAPPVVLQPPAVPVAGTPRTGIPEVSKPAPRKSQAKGYESASARADAGRPSRVPSVPVLFDDEPTGTEEEGEAPEPSGPQILLEPLHVLDPLCIKWGIGMGMSAPSLKESKQASRQTPAAAQKSVPVFLSSPSPRTPSSSKQAAGYVRLMGILSNGSPWEYSVALSDLVRTNGVALGRDGSCCNVVLPEGSISRRHALLECVNNDVVVTDLGSTNGTSVNGHRISPATEQRVTMMDGSILTLGDVTLRVEIQQPAPSFVPV